MSPSCAFVSGGEPHLPIIYSPAIAWWVNFCKSSCSLFSANMPPRQPPQSISNVNVSDNISGIKTMLAKGQRLNHKGKLLSEKILANMPHTFPHGRHKEIADHYPWTRLARKDLKKSHFKSCCLFAEVMDFLVLTLTVYQMTCKVSHRPVLTLLAQTTPEAITTNRYLTAERLCAPLFIKKWMCKKKAWLNWENTE